MSKSCCNRKATRSWCNLWSSSPKAWYIRDNLTLTVRTNNLKRIHHHYRKMWNNISKVTLAPTELATSRSLVLNSNGLQLQILCCNLSASKHLAAPSMDSICMTLSPIAAAEPMAVSYWRKAFYIFENFRVLSVCEFSIWNTHINIAFFSVDVAHDAYATSVRCLVTRY